MAEEKISMSPDVRSNFTRDDTKRDIEVSLPGVNKGDIGLKLNGDGFSIRRLAITSTTSRQWRCVALLSQEGPRRNTVTVY